MDLPQKTLKGNHGELELNTPRDRNGTFEPNIVKKGQTRITGMDDQILCLYVKGMSTRDIVATFEEMYGAEISALSVRYSRILGNYLPYSNSLRRYNKTENVDKSILAVSLVEDYRMLKQVSLLLLLYIPILFSPCSFATVPIQVTFISPTPQGNPFWDNVITFMRASADDLAIDLTVIYNKAHHRTESITNTSKLANMNSKPDFIIGVFHKRTALNLLKLVDKHQIFLYTLNTGIPEKQKESIGDPREKYKYWLGHSSPDDKQVGYLMAKELISKFEVLHPNYQSLPILAISGTTDSTPSFDRNNGLHKALQEHPKVKLNQLVFSDWTQVSAYKKSLGLLNRYPETKIIWAASDSIALGAVNARGDKNILISGTDWTSSGITAVKNGKIISSYGGHFTEGGFALVMLYDFFHGIDFINDPGLKVETDFYKIDSLNVDQYQTFFADQNWQKIDFRRFSKKLTPSIRRYDFSWKAIYSNVEHPDH